MAEYDPRLDIDGYINLTNSKKGDREQFIVSQEKTRIDFMIDLASKLYMQTNFSTVTDNVTEAVKCLNRAHDFVLALDKAKISSYINNVIEPIE